jgi:hypothetical protein
MKLIVKCQQPLLLLVPKEKFICDATELKIYFKEADCPAPYTKGWNIKHINDFAEEVDFYLRGEEYSAQVDYFIKATKGKVPNNKNTFESAWLTDNVIDKIKKIENN